MAVSLNIPKPAPQKKKNYWIDVLIILIILAFLGGGVYLFLFGFKDYSEMMNMQLTWTEVVKIADSVDPEAPPEYLEYAIADTNIPTKEDLSQGIIIPELSIKQLPDEKDMSNVKVEERIDIDYLYRPINLNALREINPDVSGYIYVANTNIDYPILKETVPEAYYYLNHNINREVDKYGSIFELSDSERDTRHINNAVNLIFGHHMKSGAMFANLFKYSDQTFASSTPIYIYRDDYRIEYKPVAACTVNAYDNIYDFDAFELGSDEYKDILDWIKSKNQIKPVVDFPTENESIIVLSTCRDAYSDVRFIVVLKETRRALIPEYYQSLKEVYQYGGDSTAVAVPSER